MSAETKETPCVTCEVMVPDSAERSYTCRDCSRVICAACHDNYISVSFYKIKNICIGCGMAVCVFCSNFCNACADNDDEHDDIPVFCSNCNILNATGIGNIVEADCDQHTCFLCEKHKTQICSICYI
jgi:hypothetical protein